MSVNIDFGNFVLTSSSEGWVIGEKKVGKEGNRAGEEYIGRSWYPSGLPGALSFLMELHLRNCDARSLEELRKEFLAFRDKLGEHFELNLPRATPRR